MIADLPLRADASGRECGCPVQVERCVHFDGKALILSSRSLLPATVRERHAILGYGVGIVSYSASSECVCGCGWQHWWLALDVMLYGGDDYSVALAAFEAAAERLRAGDLG